MTTESDIIEYLTDAANTARMIAQNGYVNLTVSISGYSNLKTEFSIYHGPTLSFQAGSLSECFKKLQEEISGHNEAKTLMEKASDLRTRADEMEAKAKALLAEQTPALI